MDPSDLHPRSHEAKFLHVPYKDRWECLKPVIVALYMDEYGPGGRPMTMRQVADFMKQHYTFHAAVNEYQRHFREWGVRKRTLVSEKNEIVSALGKRPQPGTSTSNVSLDQGDRSKPVDKKQLKRYLNDQIRHHQAEPMVPGTLSSYNLPYAAYAASITKEADQPSPFGMQGTTPDHLNIHSSEAMTPRRQAAGPSPPMQLIRKKTNQDRASLFLQGRYKELLMSCGREDRILLTDYLHDFYIHSFVTAKYWGRGPRFWTAGMISTLTLGASGVASPSSPASIMSPSASHQRSTDIIVPTQLCRWSIHVEPVRYDAIPEPQDDAWDGFNIQENPSSWSQWPSEDLAAHSFSESMQESITHGVFTSKPLEDLPVSTDVIVQSLQKDPTLLQTDAVKFAIMAGNTEILASLFKQNRRLPDEMERIHPFHLAASYLDGGNQCCTVIAELDKPLGGDYVFYHPVDDNGHTVLDALMISILRSHTNVRPEHVSASFRAANRYPGEEKDICGRWDADSPAIRRLFQHGCSRIPPSWKHPFCHTAVQAVCHSTITIYGSSTSPNINAPSGLFLRRCGECGLELKLGPIHTLVVVAFYLAQSGMPGETLFGALAILVCLVKLGADASLKTTMSVQDILGTAASGRCYHVDMNACDLMEAVPHVITERWSSDCLTGWSCILHTLRWAELDSDQRKEGEPERDTEDDGENNWLSNESDEDHLKDNQRCDSSFKVGVHDEWLRLPCGNPKLGILWAAIQVELLTYRRVQEGEPWISDNFLMGALKTWLEGESQEFCTPLVQRGLMNNHTRCGWFHKSDEFRWPMSEEVCREYFMNMDIYNRASYLVR